MSIQMTPSPWLWTLLESYEKFRPTAYPATAAERAKGIWTIGYGHTAGVKENDTCTMDQAVAFLHQDVASAVAAVCRLVRVPLTQNQFDALVSLTFNCGTAPLVMTLGNLLNSGNYTGAAGEFKKWDKQAGVELDGLEKRRLVEAAHFQAAA